MLTHQVDDMSPVAVQLHNNPNEVDDTSHVSNKGLPYLLQQIGDMKSVANARLIHTPNFHDLESVANARCPNHQSHNSVAGVATNCTQMHVTNFRSKNSAVNLTESSNMHGD